MSISDHARGRWPEIVAAILGADYANTRKHFKCPSGAESVDAFRFSDKHGNGGYFCKCSPDGRSDGFDLLRCYTNCSFKEAVKMVEGVIGESGEKAEPREPTWAERLRSETVKSDRSAYLESRGLTVAPGLEWHRKLPYFDEDGKKAGEYPAMMAPVTKEGRFLTYHVTYLHNGGKAKDVTCRKILPASGALQGGACELYPAEETMGVAEGIETSIAASIMHKLPVWSLLNTAIMASWRPPKVVKSVVIYADNDTNYAGHAAAYTLAHRLMCIGIEAAVCMPQKEGEDWNDILLACR